MGANPVVEKARVVHVGNPAVESLVNHLLTLLVPTDNAKNARGQAARGNASSRLRSRSREVEKGGRSRSKMGHSKSPVRKKGIQLESVDENPSAPDEESGEESEGASRGGDSGMRRGGPSIERPRGGRSATHADKDQPTNTSGPNSARGSSDAPGSLKGVAAEDRGRAAPASVSADAERSKDTHPVAPKSRSGRSDDHRRGAGGASQRENERPGHQPWRPWEGQDM
jgi:hypothetical protein